MKRMQWIRKLSVMLGGLPLLIVLAGCAAGAAPTPEPAEPTEQTAAATATVAEAEPTATEVEVKVEPEATEAVEEPAEETAVDTSRYDEFEIVTLLPQDAIPAIDNPTFHTAEEADDFYEPDELVMGVMFNGDARAYSVPHLSGHEIVNDEVGGVKIAVTW